MEALRKFQIARFRSMAPKIFARFTDEFMALVMDMLADTKLDKSQQKNVIAQMMRDEADKIKRVM